MNAKLLIAFMLAVLLMSDSRGESFKAPLDGVRLHVARADDSAPLIVFVGDGSIRLHGRLELTFPISKDAEREIVEKAAKLSREYRSSEEEKFSFSLYVGVCDAGKESGLLVTRQVLQKSPEIAGILNLVERVKELAGDNGKRIDQALSELLRSKP